MKVTTNYTTMKRPVNNTNFGMLNMDPPHIAQKLRKGLKSPELAQQAADVLEKSRAVFEQLSEGFRAHVLPNKTSTGVVVLVEEETSPATGRIQSLREKIQKAVQVRLLGEEESVLVGESANGFDNRVAEELKNKTRELDHIIWKSGSLRSES